MNLNDCKFRESLQFEIIRIRLTLPKLSYLHCSNVIIFFLLSTVIDIAFLLLQYSCKYMKTQYSPVVLCINKGIFGFLNLIYLVCSSYCSLLAT